MEQKRFSRKAQSTLEYAILLVVVAAACVAMRMYVQRATRASLRVIQDQMNAGPVKDGTVITQN